MERSTSRRRAPPGSRCTRWGGLRMLEHLNPEPRKPARVVVIGAAGFVGGALASRLDRDGVPVLRLARNDVDLRAPDAAARLQFHLRATDARVAAAATAPRQ